MANIKGRGKTRKKGFSQTKIIHKAGGVTLRARKKNDGGESLYLDFTINGKRQYEFLKTSLVKVRTQIDRQNNKKNLKLAESIRAKRAMEINSVGHDFIPESKRKVNFIAYFEYYISEYNKKDIRLLQGALKHFKEFVREEYIGCNELTENLLIKFKEYLEQRLNGETPFNYFKKLKKVIKQAVRDDLILKNPTIDIMNKKIEGIKKEILTMEEIQKLAQTDCGNSIVKRAALYSGYTGLRWCDVSIMKWKNINGNIMKLKQSKTDKDVTQKLHPFAISLLGKRGEPEETIFMLPSHNACLKLLRTWTKKANIHKHITWHCFRHSYGTNLSFHGNANSKTIMVLLGSSDIREAERYIREADKLKEDAVLSLPAPDEIEIEI